MMIRLKIQLKSGGLTVIFGYKRIMLCCQNGALILKNKARSFWLLIEYSRRKTIS
jgi:hypothetical protein